MSAWLMAAWLVAVLPTPAVPVPSEITICVNHAEQRCWSAAGRDACAGGEVFAITPALDDPDAKLRACESLFPPLKQGGQGGFSD